MTTSKKDIQTEITGILWKACDTFRGAVDPSEYKNYILVMLFVKYFSDKYAGKPYDAITVPEGASFADLVAIKGKSDIGDKLNTKMLAPLATANKLSDMPDFKDATKLGRG